jgi:hypothetical protein
MALLDAIASDLKFNDFSGSVLDRFRTVVTKVARLPLDPDITAWQDMVGLFEIRNCLVHAGANLAEFPKASTVKEFAARHRTPDCSSQTLQVDRSTSKVALEVASVFLQGIYDIALQAFPGEYGPGFRKSRQGQSSRELG